MCFVTAQLFLLVKIVLNHWRHFELHNTTLQSIYFDTFVVDRFGHEVWFTMPGFKGLWIEQTWRMYCSTGISWEIVLLQRMLLLCCIRLTMRLKFCLKKFIYYYFLIHLENWVVDISVYYVCKKSIFLFGSIKTSQPTILLFCKIKSPCRLFITQNYVFTILILMYSQLAAKWFEE